MSNPTRARAPLSAVAGLRHLRVDFTWSTAQWVREKSRIGPMAKQVCVKHKIKGDPGTDGGPVQDWAATVCLVNYVLVDTAVLAYVSSRVFHATRVAVSHYTETVWPTELKIFTCGLFPWPL